MVSPESQQQRRLQLTASSGQDRKTPFQLRVGAEAHTIDQMPSVLRGLTDTTEYIQNAFLCILYIHGSMSRIWHRASWERTPGPANVGQPRQKMPSLNKPTPPVGWPIGSHPHCVPRRMQSFSTGGRRLVVLTLTLVDWLGSLERGQAGFGRVVCGLQPKLGRQKPTIRSFSQHARQRGPLREATKEATGLDCSPGLRGPQRHLDSFWSAWLHAAPGWCFSPPWFHITCLPFETNSKGFLQAVRAGSRWFKRTDHLPHEAVPLTVSMMLWALGRVHNLEDMT